MCLIDMYVHIQHIPEYIHYVYILDDAAHVQLNIFRVYLEI